MTLPLSEKVAIVIGASAGIGRAYALALAQAGASVVAAARTLGPPSGEVNNTLAHVVRMGRDLSFRADIKKRVASDKHRLYGDRACIAALEDFLDRAARARA